MIAEEDNQGKLWHAMLSFYRQQPRFRVVKDKPAELPFGPPLKLVSCELNGRTRPLTFPSRWKTNLATP